MAEQQGWHKKEEANPDTDCQQDRAVDGHEWVLKELSADPGIKKASQALVQSKQWCSKSTFIISDNIKKTLMIVVYLNTKVGYSICHSRILGK